MLLHEHAPGSAPTDTDGARGEARRWVHKKRGLYMVVAVLLYLGVMWFGVDLLDESNSFRLYWQMLGAGVLVAIGGVVLFGIAGVFGADWERRQVDRHVARRKRRDSDTSRGA